MRVFRINPRSGIVTHEVSPAQGIDNRIWAALTRILAGTELLRTPL